jgi:hypothetical protein
MGVAGMDWFPAAPISCSTGTLRTSVLAITGDGTGPLMRDVDKQVQQRELLHPTRFRIWELYTKNPDRSLTALAFHGDLIKEEKFRDLTVSQVSYHLARLQDAELVPLPVGG